MITLKYPSLKANSMSWKLKCQDCKNRHVGHLWPSRAGQGTWHGDISRGLITTHHTSLSLGSGNSLDHKSRAFFSSLWAADGPGGNIHPAAAVRGAPREAWSCPVDTGTVKMWQGYNESCVNMSVASSLWSVTHSASLWWTTITASPEQGRPPDPRTEEMSGKASLKVAERSIQSYYYTTSYCKWW